jgi:polygalacturonase
MASRFSRRQVLKAGVALAGGMASSSLLGKGMAWAAPRALPPWWPQAQQILSEIKVPVFPSAVFDVTKFGARGDGSTDNTAAFAAAISACNAAGGGHVNVPAGTYVTGAIHLLSNVDFHTNAGTTLRFSGDATKYPLVLTRYEGIECMNHSPMVYAFGQQNIGFTGPGVLDASGTGSWNKGSSRAGVLEPMLGRPPSQRNVAGRLRATFVEPYNCDTVLLQGFTLRQSQFWQMHPTLCTNVTVDGVTTGGTLHSNTDGCDPECCDHMVIQNCNLGAHDDTIAIKSGRDVDGRRVNKPTSNLVIMNNVHNGNWGMITCGSELTGGIENVFAFNNSGSTRYAIYLKSNTRRGGFIRNLNVDSTHAHGLIGGFGFATMTYNGQTGGFPPDFSNINVSNCTCAGAPFPFHFSGLSSDPIKGVSVSNTTLTGIGRAADVWSNVTGLTVSGLSINGHVVPR